LDKGRELIISALFSIQELEARLASMQAESARIMEEERRKTLIEETKHARAVSSFMNKNNGQINNF
jgi:uncharacterized small protein (DUF1192 family)